jgi:hypothetical protein
MSTDPFSDPEIGLHRREAGRHTPELRFTSPGSDSNEGTPYGKRDIDRTTDL